MGPRAFSSLGIEVRAVRVTSPGDDLIKVKAPSARFLPLLLFPSFQTLLFGKEPLGPAST